MHRYQASWLFGCLVLLFPATIVSAYADDKKPTAEPPPVVDLRKFQTSIKNQGGRDSCPYFPPVAALEAAYKHKGIDVNLSVEHLIWLRNVTAGNNKESCDVAENLFQHGRRWQRDGGAHSICH